MSFKIRGDFGALDNMADGLERFDKQLPQMMMAIGNAAVGLTRESFRNQASPWGAKWPKKQCKDGRQTLIRTGTMKASYHVKAHSATSVTIGSGVFYSAVHQNGAVIKAKNPWTRVTKTGKRVDMPPMLRWKCGKVWRYAKQVTIPARPMVPERDALPPDWSDEFGEIASAALRRAIG